MNTEELNVTFLKSLDLFTTLRDKYPALAGDLVFSSSRGQCHITTSVLGIFKTFPDMISDSPQKEKASGIVQSIVMLEKERKNATADVKESINEKIKKLTREVNPLLKPLEFREDTFVEIRFNEKKVNLPLIFGLQKDELVSRVHTPQSKASVRIVLGTIGEIYAHKHPNNK